MVSVIITVALTMAALDLLYLRIASSRRLLRSPIQPNSCYWRIGNYNFWKNGGQDWTNQKFKVVVSQTVYAAMHVNFEGKLAQDADTNGFPEVGRDRAVRLFQRCGALVISGD